MSESNYPPDLRYHPKHDWARIDGDEATLGVTWYAQDSLGEVVFFEPPPPGTMLVTDEPYAEIESVKAVSDVVAPLAGEIVAINQMAVERPEVINQDPYGEGWLVRIRMSDPAEPERLLDAGAYETLLEEGR